MFVLKKYAKIEYPTQKILMELIDNTAFLTNINQINPISHLPDYCLGLTETYDDVNIVIDLAKFLKINDKEIVKNPIYIQYNNPPQSFILKVPNIDVLDEIPPFGDFISHKTEITEIPESKFYHIDGEIFLLLEYELILNFLKSEIGTQIWDVWISNKPKWSEELFTPYLPDRAQPTISSYLTKNITPISNKSHELFMFVTIGDYHLVIDGKYVRDILSDSKSITSIKTKQSWIDGIFDYQNDTILSISLSKLLDTELKSNPNQRPTIILSDDNYVFAFSCDSITTSNEMNAISIKTDSYSSTDLLFNNISIVDSEFVYHLNFDAITYHIIYDLDFSQNWNFWRELLTNEVKSVKTGVQSSQIKFVEDGVLIKTNGYNLIIPVEKISDIRSVNSRQAVEFDNFVLSADENNWFPVLKLSEYLNTNTNGIYTVVVQDKNKKIEFVGEDLQLINSQELKSTTLDLDKLNIRKIGIDKAYLLGNDIIYSIDVSKIMKQDKISSIYKELNSLDLPEIKLEENKDTELELTQIWEKDAELLIIVNYLKDNNKMTTAISIDNVKELSFNKPESAEVNLLFPDIKYSDKTYIILNNEKVIEIPEDCYLIGINKKYIKGKGKNRYVIYDDKEIPLMTLS